MNEDQKKRLEELARRAKTDDAGMTNKEWQELDELNSIAAEERAAAIVLPTCCEAIRKYPPISFSINYYDVDSNTDDGEWSIALNDYLSTRQSMKDEKWHNNIPAPKFCPYCATPLPKMVRKNPIPEGICRVTDGGYYCDNCRERLMGCKCLPLSAAFEPSSEENNERMDKLGSSKV